jgi:mono/diheme cytochrome c family protein
MRRVPFGIIGCLLASGCSVEPAKESVGEAAAPLDVTATQSLTRKEGALGSNSSESFREDDTSQYYNTVQVDSTGHTIGGNNGILKDLTSFKTYYFSSGTERIVYYYNRGDLGIGREMHCVDGLTSTGGQVACYVKNFAGGDDKSEFTFGLSSNIAFNNMTTGHAFATVAMVYRNGVVGANNVFFIVYGADEKLQMFAALDRTGQLFANAFAAGTNIAAVNGVNFNNHVPTNCLACHGGGGSYDSSAHTVTGALFLPFDLDQFDYQAVAGMARADQLTTFKHLNEAVWKVAALSGSDLTFNNKTPLRNQLNTWYTNAVFSSRAIDEVFENDFDSTQVPVGWNTALGKTLYQSVARGSCRNCHQANMSFPFETEADFVALLPVAVPDLCSFAMPHSLQTIRQFWQSSQPTALAGYLTATGNTSLASTLRGCGPGNVATLDPPLISAVLFR